MSQDDVPHIGLTDEEVEALEVDYCDRAPDDWVISGRLPDGAGPGRYFPSWERAEMWARSKYGRRFKRRWTAPDGRWSFLIRERGKGNE